MARSIYQINGALFWFEDGKQPAGAVKVEKKDREPENKAKTTTVRKKCK